MSFYERLRPRTDFRACDCDTVSQLLLVYTLIDNPIQCFRCKGVVDPERLALSEQQVEAVANWLGVFGPLYDLWLDSSDYEAWAKGQLLRKDGRANVLGMKTIASLSSTMPTYYWWFHQSDDEPPALCPWCCQQMGPAQSHGNRQCDMCRIVV